MINLKYAYLSLIKSLYRLLNQSSFDKDGLLLPNLCLENVLNLRLYL